MTHYYRKSLNILTMESVCLHIKYLPTVMVHGRETWQSNNKQYSSDTARTSEAREQNFDAFDVT